MYSLWTTLLETYQSYGRVPFPSFQEFFKRQLKKHETLITYIEQNLSAQDNILSAMTEANA